jgi:hypothetical protein
MLLPVLNVTSVTSEVIIKDVLSKTYKQPIRNFNFKVLFFKYEHTHTKCSGVYLNNCFCQLIVKTSCSKSPFLGPGYVAILLEGDLLTDHLTEQLRTNISQPGGRPSTERR